MTRIPIVKSTVRTDYSRAMAAIWAVQLLTSGSVFVLALLPRMLDREQISVGWQGWIMAAFSIAYLVGVLSGSRFCRRRGYRWTALWGCVGAVVGCLCYPLGWHWLPTFFLARILHGLGCAWVVMAYQGWIMNMADVQHRGRTLGMTNLPGFVTLAISPALAEAISRLGWFDGIFFLAAGLCLALVPFLRALPSQPLEGGATRVSKGDRMHWVEWCLIMFLLTHGIVVSYASMLLPLASDPAKGWAFSAFFLTYGATAFVMRSIVEKRVQAWLSMEWRIILVCLVSVGTVMLAVAGGTGAFASIGILFGIGHGLFYPSLVQLVTRYAAGEHVVLRVGILTGAGLIGNMIGAGFAGGLAQFVGVKHALAWGGSVVLLLQVVLLLAIRIGFRPTLCPTRGAVSSRVLQPNIEPGPKPKGRGIC